MEARGLGKLLHCQALEEIPLRCHGKLEVPTAGKVRRVHLSTANKIGDEKAGER